MEERLALSWYGAPPTAIAPPTGAVSVTLDVQGDATGNASIAANENDYYSFVAPTSGPYRINSLTPSSNLDTVLGVFSASGTRLAFNDDISSTNRDSQLTVNLAAGNQYFFGVTNYTRTSGGSYTWQVDGPSVALVDDGFEDNDSSSLAANLGSLTAPRTVGNLVMADAADWFSFTVLVDDLLIDAQSVAIDGSGGILGQAGPDWLRGGSALPFHGVMQFDTADLAAMESNGTLYDVIAHEMGHVLGIGTIWQTLGLLAGAGTANPLFLGSRAIAEYNVLFGTSASGVPVEGTPAPEGTRDGHWRESLFGNELMSGYISGASNPINRITVGSLADIGYTVNMAAADAYTPPSLRTVTTAGATGGSGTSLVFAEPADPLSPPTRRSPYRSTAAWFRRPVTTSLRPTV